MSFYDLKHLETLLLKFESMVKNPESKVSGLRIQTIEITVQLVRQALLVKELEGDLPTVDLYKVIGVDNLDRESVSDLRMPQHEKLTKAEAERIADELNSKDTEFAFWYYKAVPQSQPLYTYDPIH